MTYKLGDIVQVLTWQYMARKFKIDKDGYIVDDTRTIFSQGMRQYCGQKAQVLFQTEIGYYKLQFINETEMAHYVFASETLKPTSVQTLRVDTKFNKKLL